MIPKDANFIFTIFTNSPFLLKIGQDIVVILSVVIFRINPNKFMKGIFEFKLGPLNCINQRPKILM